MGISRAITDFAFTTALDYVSGTATRNGAALDMLGFQGVLMVVKFAAIADPATCSIKAQQDTASGMGTAADLAGTGQTVGGTTDNQIYIIDLYQPVKRYVRLVVVKDATNAVAESAIYIQYGAAARPQAVAVASAVNFERWQSPAEGTA